MSFIRKKSKGRTYEYYICNQYSNKKTCKPNLIPKMEIEERFFDILDKIVTEEEFKDTMLKSADGSKSQIKEVEQKIKNKEKEIKERKKKILDICCKRFYNVGNQRWLLPVEMKIYGGKSR